MNEITIPGSSGRTLIVKDDKDNGTVEFIVEYIGRLDGTDIDKELVPALIDFLQKCIP